VDNQIIQNFLFILVISTSNVRANSDKSITIWDLGFRAHRHVDRI
jgi:hypothetical protein